MNTMTSEEKTKPITTTTMEMILTALHKRIIYIYMSISSSSNSTIMKERKGLKRK
jgi:hypothetical protein